MRQGGCLLLGETGRLLDETGRLLGETGRLLIAR